MLKKYIKHQYPNNAWILNNFMLILKVSFEKLYYYSPRVIWEIYTFAKCSNEKFTANRKKRKTLLLFRKLTKLGGKVAWIHL